MAVNLVTVTGSLETLSGATPMLGRMWFKLNRPDWNLTGDIFAPEYIEAIANTATGAFTVAMQSTNDFQTGATYSAILRYREPLDGKDREYTVGTFALAPGGPFELGDLLTVPIIAPVPADILALCQAYAASASTNAASSLINANAAAASAVTAALYAGVEVNTFAALLALTSANAPAVGEFVLVKETSSIWKRVASAGHVTLFTTTLFWEVQALVVTPEMFGAVGSSAVPDTLAFRALQALARPVLGGAKTYLISQGITLFSFVGQGITKTKLQATVAMTTLLTITGNNAIIDGVELLGNAGLADWCLEFNTANGSRGQVSCSGAKIDGCRLTAVGNNNSIAFENSRFRNNGRIWRQGVTLGGGAINTVVTGTLASTAGGTLATFTGFDPSTLGLRVNVARLIIAGHAAPYIVTAVTATTISVYPNMTATSAGVGFAIMDGNGLFIPRHPDNNVCTISGGDFSGNACDGVTDHSLYGSYQRFNVYDSNGGYGAAFGERLLGGITYGARLDHPYFEVSNNRPVYAALTDELIIVGESVLNSLNTIRIDAAAKVNIIGRYGPQAVEIVLPTTYTIVLRNTVVVQSSAASDVILLLPNAPVFATFPETYTISLATIGGKLVTVRTTAAGSLINGVSGLVGVGFRGNWRSLVATWSPNQNGWTISATPSLLYGSATYDPPSIAAGAETTTTVTVTGAALGDLARASFSIDSALKISARISSAGFATVTFRNDTVAAIDPPSGTLSVEVTDVT